VIWRHLTNPTGLSEAAQKVTVRYLAGIARHTCALSMEKSFDAVVELLGAHVVVEPIRKARRELAQILAGELEDDDEDKRELCLAAHDALKTVLEGSLPPIGIAPSSTVQSSQGTLQLETIVAALEKKERALSLLPPLAAGKLATTRTSLVEKRKELEDSKAADNKAHSSAPAARNLPAEALQRLLQLWQAAEALAFSKGHKIDDNLLLAKAFISMPADLLLHLFDPSVLKDVTDVCSAATMLDKLVGFDLFGDERFRPFSPFHATQIINRLRDAKLLNVRLHGGERSPDEERTGGDTAHMAVVAHGIEALAQHAAVRVGHGVLCASFVSLRKSGKADGEDPRGFCENAIKSCLDVLETKKIAIEVNLTSNATLLEAAGNAIDALLKAKLVVVLATDNDGIWDCSADGYGSVLAEFIRASRHPSVGTSRIGTMIKMAEVSRFVKH
jgi:hypothetical protein